MESASEIEGQVLAGRYRVGERIGEGGMGAVHRAFDERLQREVAIKLLPAHAVGDEAARERLRREALFGASMEHPGIAHVYDVGETDDGGVFLVMELVKGAWTRALLRSDTWDDRARVAAIVDTARALGAAHRAGLVHRDVKPDNVMLRTDGRVVLLDFGIAKPGVEGVDILTLTGRGALLGTPAYLAPEQAHGKPADARTDQFALAVTAYEVLARVLPWPTSSGLRLLTAILSDPPPPLHVATDAALSETLRPVLERALAKDPAQRYPDIDTFADALARAAGITTGPLRDPPVALPPSSLQSPGASTLTVLSRTEILPVITPSSGRRRRWWQWPVALAGVAASLVTFFTWRAHRNPLAVAEPVLACVLFEGRDHGEPAAWLGAAGASRFCEYAAPALGGTHRHVRFPADLLRLPHQPTHDFPEDPYEERDAPARTLAEARRLALPYVDGSVEASDDGFEVRVGLHAADGRLLGDASGKGETLGEATGAALDALVTTGAVPARASLDGDFDAFFGPRSVREAMVDARLPFEFSWLDRSAALRRLCATSGPRSAAKEGLVWRRACLQSRPGSVDAEPPPEDRPPLSDVGGQVLYLDKLYFYAQALTEADRARTSEALGAQLSTLQDPTLRAMVKETQADLASGGHDDAQWEANDLAAAQLDPRVVACGNQGFDANQVRESNGLGPRTAAAWAPDNPHVWRGRSLSRRPGDVTHTLDWTRRWYLLDPRTAADSYGNAALRAGRSAVVHTIAARLAMSDVPEDHDESTLLENLALAAKNDIARAYDHLWQTLPDSLNAFSVNVVGTLRQMALLLGREHELADRIVDRYFVKGYPLEGKIDGGTGVGKLAAICAYASKDKAGRCLAGLRERAAGNVFGSVEMVETAERWVAGDVEGAGQAVRRAMRQPWFVIRTADFLLMVLDAARLFDLADQIDGPQAVQRGIYNGEDWFTVLRARRAFARGDRETGRALARRIIDAWKLADAPVPAVAEMERELAKP